MIKNKFIKKLVNKQVPWLENNSPESDIAISSRIRLARNISGFNFPLNRKDDSPKNDILNFIKTPVSKLKRKNRVTVIKTEELSRQELTLLLERHLISLNFSSGIKNSGIMLNSKEDIAVMINEEDHFRIQAFKPGLQLKNTWKIINDFEDDFGTYIPYAYDTTLGFLTACPSNAGTGMRASVMLHLPALVISKQITPLLRGISKLGLAARGLFGEGTDNLGNIFQISNQSTLGESELNIINRLESVISQIIMHEKNARQKLLETDQEKLLDSVGRAFGRMRYAYIVSMDEALSAISMIRLGVDMGIIKSLSLQALNNLFISIFPAHMQLTSKKPVNQQTENIIRAEIIRNTLAENS